MQGEGQGEGRELAYGMRLPAKGRPVVVEVVEGSAAEVAGVAVGDVVVAVGEEHVARVEEVCVSVCMCV